MEGKQAESASSLGLMKIKLEKNPKIIPPKCPKKLILLEPSSIPLPDVVLKTSGNDKKSIINGNIIIIHLLLVPKIAGRAFQLIMKNPIKDEIKPQTDIEAPTLLSSGEHNTENRLPKIPLMKYKTIYLQVPIKYSSIVPIIKIEKQFANICSKLACKKLFVIKRYDS